LVSIYFGHTSAKTQDILYDNIGKILFIKGENLLFPLHDHFCMEMLRTIHVYIHIYDILVIFVKEQKMMYQFNPNIDNVYEIFK
jgi:hypothetical protein